MACQTGVNLLENGGARLGREAELFEADGVGAERLQKVPVRVELHLVGDQPLQVRPLQLVERSGYGMREVEGAVAVDVLPPLPI